jgi:hypothetical protein
MIKVAKNKYQFHFHESDYTDLIPAKEDVFYEFKGNLYSQFYKGQLIPKEVFDDIFTDLNEIKEEIVVEKKVNAIEKPTEKKEPRVRKKRAKSIIKSK